jgi:hypothetical protein
VGDPSNGEENGILKTMWNLKIPNVAKMFMWRACQNLLPTKSNLLRRRVVEKALCPICWER